MALGLGASGQVFLEIGLFGHGLGVTFHAVGVLESGLGMDHVVQALLALFAGQVIVAASAATFGEAFLAVNRVVTGHAFHLGMGSVGKHDGLLRAFDLQRFVGHGGGGPSAYSKEQGQHTGKSKGFFHDSPPW